jgi:nitric oxide reductase subunit B
MATEAAPSPRPDTSTSAPLISRGWLQGVALVMIFGFLVMGILVYRTYAASMPMPDKVVSESGEVLFTGPEITRGQELYQARGLMCRCSATAPTWGRTTPRSTCAWRPTTSPRNGTHKG